MTWFFCTLTVGNKPLVDWFLFCLTFIHAIILSSFYFLKNHSNSVFHSFIHLFIRPYFLSDNSFFHLLIVYQFIGLLCSEGCWVTSQFFIYSSIHWMFSVRVIVSAPSQYALQGGVPIPKRSTHSYTSGDALDIGKLHWRPDDSLPSFWSFQNLKGWIRGGRLPCLALCWYQAR